MLSALECLVSIIRFISFTSLFIYRNLKSLSANLILTSNHNNMSRELHAINANARKIIEEGLKLDENSATRANNQSKIKELYLKGADELQKGLKLSDTYTNARTDQDKEAIKQLRETMKRSLEKLLDRLESFDITDNGKTPPKQKPLNAVPPTVLVAKAKTTNDIPNSRSQINGARVPSRYSTLPGPSRRATLTETTTLRVQTQTRLTRNNSMNAINTRPSSGNQPTRNRVASRIPSPPRKYVTIPGVDSKIVKQIIDEILEAPEQKTFFRDISGQERAKDTLKEMLVWPRKNPELFKALRSPPKGLLLFGPPGNGKTLLAKAVASETDATFFNVSASTLTSKWVGEGEKLVKALFEVARHYTPSIIFIDEIDSILKQRTDSEHEASRRLKTELFIQMDGMKSFDEDGVVVVAATNRPQELDNAGLRRFPKRIYVGLPDRNARKDILTSLMAKQGNHLRVEEYYHLAKLTEGFSASDLTHLAKDAAFGPIRELDSSDVETVKPSEVRSIRVSDFVSSLKKVRASVSPDAIKALISWNDTYGDISL